MVDTGILLAKIGFIIGIFTLALLTGMIPVKCKGFKESPVIIGVANAFSGGVFLAIALVHVLPDITHDYEEWIKGQYGEETEMEDCFPLPYFLMFCGYSFILLVDKVMFDSHGLLHAHGEHGHGHGHDHSHGHSHG